MICYFYKTSNSTQSKSRLTKNTFRLTVPIPTVYKITLRCCNRLIRLTYPEKKSGLTSTPVLNAWSGNKRESSGKVPVKEMGCPALQLLL